jgi:uncharacterized protein (TIGR00369 family)
MSMPERLDGQRQRILTWEDPAALTNAASRLSGRELLQAIVDGTLPRPPFAALVGAELVAVGDGEAVFRCTPDESSYSPLGMVHGGLLCTLLDSAAGCAVQSQLPAGVAYSSVEIKVSFLRPLRAGMGAIEVHGRTLRTGGRIAFAEAHARDAHGELIGHATTSLALIRDSNR